MKRNIIAMLLAALLAATAAGCRVQTSFTGTPAPENGENDPLPMDAAAAMIESFIIGAGYFDYEVSASEDEILAVIWQGDPGSFLPGSSGEKRERLVSLAEEMQGMVEISENENATVRLRVYDNRDHELTLFEIENGEIVHDALGGSGTQDAPPDPDKKEAVS